MPTREEDPELYATRRDWHRRRAIVNKERQNVSRLAVEHMTERQLHFALYKRLHALEQKLSNEADVHAYVDVRDALSICVELQARGTQLQLFPEDIPPSGY